MPKTKGKAKANLFPPLINKQPIETASIKHNNQNNLKQWLKPREGLIIDHDVIVIMPLEIFPEK